MSYGDTAQRPNVVAKSVFTERKDSDRGDHDHRAGESRTMERLRQRLAADSTGPCTLPGLSPRGVNAHQGIRSPRRQVQVFACKNMVAGPQPGPVPIQYLMAYPVAPIIIQQPRPNGLGVAGFVTGLLGLILFGRPYWDWSSASWDRFGRSLYFCNAQSRRE